VLLSLSRFRRGSLRIAVRFHRIAVGHADNHALGLCLLLGALRQLFLRLPFSAELEKGTRRLLLGRFAAATRPAPGRSRSASNAPRGSSAIAAIEPATGPNPNRCNASAASNLGLVVMVSSRASSSILGRAPALDQPRAQSSLRISSTMAQPRSAPRH